MILSAVAAVITGTIPAHAADVGVSASVGQPGFYGRIDIGDYSQPTLIYREPIVIQRPVGVVYEPLYLRLPPGQTKNGPITAAIITLVVGRSILCRTAGTTTSTFPATTSIMLKAMAEAMTAIMIMEEAMVIGTKVTAEVIKAPSILHHY